MKKIVITGGSGRFGEVLKKYKTKHQIYFPKKKELNILKIKSFRFGLSYLIIKKEETDG